MSKLKIRVLGALSFLDETGAELALTRKNRTVLAAIVLAGDLGLTREKLAVLFWGDRGEKQAQASVRQALAAICKGLGPFWDCLQAGPDHLAVNGQRVELDAEAFETLAASPSAGDGDRALALYRGNLLEGIRLKEEDFEAWLRPMRERLRGLAVSLLEAGLEAADDKPRTIALALRLLELEAINEPAHRALIRTYAA
jgi:DNA-binding SARP family transcriptional activator